MGLFGTGFNGLSPSLRGRVGVGLLLALLFLSACTGSHSYRYRIGVSQCVGGKWR